MSFGSCFPNGFGKLLLYEHFLQVSDFACSGDEFLFELECLRLAERSGGEECRWHEEEDHRAFVDGLELADRHLRIEITESGFRRSRSHFDTRSERLQSSPPSVSFQKKERPATHRRATDL
jgi:hypothetical protein